MILDMRVEDLEIWRKIMQFSKSDCVKVNKACCCKSALWMYAFSLRKLYIYHLYFIILYNSEDLNGLMRY